jgi:hypothetical protein
MTRWAVPLDGDEHDLVDLAAKTWLGVKVEKRDDGTWVLTSPRFEPLTNGYEVLLAANEVVGRLNAAARLGDSHYRAVRTRNAVFDGDLVMNFGSAEFRGGGRLTVSLPDAPPTLAERAFALAPANPPLNDALRFFDQATWAAWYNVWEIVRAEINPIALRCVSDAMKTRFTRTANHQEALGDDARHQRSVEQPPPDPMSDAEGEDFARRLIECLIRQIEARG